MKKFRTLSLSVLALLLWLAALGCSSQKKEPAERPETVRGLGVTAAQKATVPDWIDAVGTVRAVQTAQVASQVMGNIVGISVREGDHVAKGQVLAVIDDAQLRAASDRATAAGNAADKEAIAADAEFGLAESTLKRYQDLFEKKSVSPQEFDEVRAKFQAAQARRDMARAGQAQARAAMAQAETTFEYTRVRAPFDGMITEKKTDVGTLAGPGMPLFVVEDTGRYRLEASVNENEIRYVKIGAAVPVSIDAVGDQPTNGRVTQIVPAADPGSRSFLVKLDLPFSKYLRSGLFGRAQFARGQRESLVVPRTAVVTRGQLQGMYVVGADQIAGLRYVTLGRAQGNQVEVLSGLEGGERFVADPGERDLGGKVIEVR